jgi:DNA-binding Lrp family transcriptional regulator
MPDKIDMQILRLLLKDAGKSRKYMAREVGISEPSLSKRISALQQDGIIRNFSAVLDYDKLGFTSHTLTYIKIVDEHKAVYASIVEEIAKLDEAVEVFQFFGEWDIVVRWMTRSNSAAMDALSRVIGSEMIRTTKTEVIAKTIKRNFGPLDI